MAFESLKHFFKNAKKYPGKNIQISRVVTSHKCDDHMQGATNFLYGMALQQ